MKRQDVPIELTWNLGDIYKDVEDFKENLEHIQEQIKTLENLEIAKMSTTELGELLKAYENYYIHAHRLYIYVALEQSVDMTNADVQQREGLLRSILSDQASRLSYVESELHKLPVEKLEDVAKEFPQYRVYIDELLRERPHRLGDETEKAFAALSPLFGLPSNTYEMIKLADMQFDDFEVDGKTYPMSYVEYENNYSYVEDTKLRRAAYDAFYSTIGKYSYGIGSGYLTQIQTEKTLSKLRGFESVTEYHLHPQQVEREIYETHLETMMTHLSPVMQKYAGALKNYLGLDELHYSDLKTTIDSHYSPKVDIEQAKKDVEAALLPLGEEYNEIVHAGLHNRWIDFAQNQGKSTGGFCASPYQIHSYILLSWTGILSEEFTLAHELGHAGHFQLAGRNQNYFSVEPSSYFIEAPSTCNELFLTDYLMEKEDSLRNKCYVIASILGNTYYHNFVTHFLEAYFQKRVYDKVDAGEALTTDELHQIKRDVLKEFWGDSVIIDEKAGYTWMRQPHYYMGLYPYTYSAGLSLATNAFLGIKNGSIAIDKWLDLLKAGGTMTPKEMAAYVGVDITTPKALQRSIAYVNSLVDELIELNQALQAEE